MQEFIYRHKTIIGIILVLIIFVGAGTLIFSFNHQEKIETADENKEIAVDIEGAVKNPGVYSLKNGSLIQDAINAAGSLTAEADNELLAKNINRAEILKNNQKISIPFLVVSSPQVAGETASTKINLNTATLVQLDSLPGIGPVYAQRIIDYRAKKPFSTIEEVMEIQGIGEKTFEKFKDLITI